MYGDSSSNVLIELFIPYFPKLSEIQKSIFSKISELYIPLRPHPDKYGFFNANIYKLELSWGSVQAETVRLQIQV